MADTTTARGLKASCNDRCNYANRCPGGITYKCITTTKAISGGDHMTCSCCENCGCNPCTCTKSVVTATKGNCKCAAGCTCVSCTA